MNCDISKSKLILCEWNAFYSVEIAFIGFLLHEIKQCIVFFGTSGIYYIYITHILISCAQAQELPYLKPLW